MGSRYVSSAKTSSGVGTKEARTTCCSQLYCIIFLATKDGAQRQVERYERKSIDHGAVGGRAARLVLVDKHNGITNASHVASNGVLHNPRLHPGETPDIWLHVINGARGGLL